MKRRMLLLYNAVHRSRIRSQPGNQPTRDIDLDAALDAALIEEQKKSLEWLRHPRHPRH